MLNLAPLLYRKVFAQDNGPISRVICSEVDLLGQKLCQANAYLDPALVPSKRMNGMYGNSDGTGSHKTPQVARHMAISEALERWAYWTVSRSPEAAKYLFDIDPSSTGMAAFPGLFSSKARSNAYYEALERWALASWWLGQLSGRLISSPIPGTSVIRIDHAEKGEVLVAYKRSPSGHYSYGYAAGRNFSSTLFRALVEMARNEFVLTYAKLCGSSDHPFSSFERRCLYFASEEGHRKFLSRVSEQSGTPKTMAVMFDDEIPGPWSKFATVWRVVPVMPIGYIGSRDNFFAW